MFKKFFSIAILGLILTALFAPVVFAQPIQEINTQLNAAAGAGGANYGAATDVRITANLIIRTILGLLGTIFLGLIVYAGILWMTAGGNEEKATKAKTLIFQATIGLVIVLSAYSITFFAYKLAIGDYSTGTRYDWQGTDWGGYYGTETKPPSYF